MIIEEKVIKENFGVSRRANQLGLRLDDIKIFDWSPMYVVFLYDQESVGKTAATGEGGAVLGENEQPGLPGSPAASVSGRRR